MFYIFVKVNVASWKFVADVLHYRQITPNNFLKEFKIVIINWFEALIEPFYQSKILVSLNIDTTFVHLF